MRNPAIYSHRIHPLGWSRYDSPLANAIYNPIYGIDIVTPIKQKSVWLPKVCPTKQPKDQLSTDPRKRILRKIFAFAFAKDIG